MMDRSAIETAARALAEARRSGRRLKALPEGTRPQSVDDAHAIQDATVAALGETVAGWKVSIVDGVVNRGALLASRVLQSPARMRASDVPMLGLEAEIAFRFERDMPPRERAYDKDEIAACVTALAAIEVVDTRFADYAGTPVIDRLADFVSNGGFIAGTPRPDWRGIDLSALKATLAINGRTVVEQTGGHVTGDPIIPAVALVNALRGDWIARGRIITTGTYTGLYLAAPGDQVEAHFEGFGSVALTLDK